MGDSGGLRHLVHQRMLCTALGGMAEHGNHGLGSNQCLKASCRGICDGCQLFCSRILIQTTVCKKKGSVISHILKLGIHNEETGYQFHAGSGL